ncbi:MAG: nucleoside monophosphate kinase [Nanoarchaeota archaeon]|nr:nucleoside monophosphate kinase [Nanoarchaeota archaeon]MCG2717882.1 nucleoside monophosphate kinase [Nanoarchaeota archaeon]
MKISLIGPPGAGKGTYAAELSKRHKVPIIAIGRELRRMVNTKLGKMLKEKYWGKGKLVPSKYAMNILKRKITKKGYILDGFPREITEAKMFEKIDKLDAVIFIDVSQKIILQRLHGRLQCKKCGRIYHIKNSPPKKDKICDKCKVNLYERTDDKEENIIKERFRVYREETEPVIKYYKKKGLLKKVRGEGKISEIIKNMEKIILRK